MPIRFADMIRRSTSIQSGSGAEKALTRLQDALGAENVVMKQKG